MNHALLAIQPFGLEFPLPVVVLGALTGITYGLLAVGLVLIYRTSRIINFAHGQMGAFGVAVMSLIASRGQLPYYVALLFALAAGGGAAALTELIVIRRLRNAPRVMSIVATLGVGVFLSSFAFAINPGAGSAAGIPSPTGLPVIQLGALRINQAYSAMLVFGPLAVIALTLFLRRSRFGLGIRASSANPEAARMAGISANHMSMLAWVLAGMLSALTAVLVLPATGFASSTQFGPTLLLRALAAAVIGRMTSFPVAFIAGVGLGTAQDLLLFNYPQSSSLADAALYVVILGALLLQRGGASSREEEKGSWSAVAAWQPLARAVARLPEIRIARWVGVIGGVALALVAPTLGSNTTAVTLTFIVAFAIVGLSVGVVAGLGGQLSLGQFAVAAAGAVVSFAVSERAPFLLGFLYAGFAGAAVSLVIGVPALRLKGLMLTVSTLGFALMTSYWALGQTWAIGERVLPTAPSIGGFAFDTGKSYYYLALAVLLLTLLVAWNTRRLGFGRALVAVRDNEDNARAFTLSVRRVKIQAFILAGFMAGVGGAVYGHGLTGVTPEAFPVQASIEVVAMTVIGGLGILVGPIIGAFYIIGLPRFLPLDSAGLAATQLGWLLLILYLPGGIAQGLQPLRDRFVRWATARHGIDMNADEVAPPGTGNSTLKALARPQRAPLPANAAVIEGRTLRKAFGGIVAVDEVSLTVHKGEIVGLIGPNGAGKTTTFELLSGFTRPDRGQVFFEGADVSALSPEQRGRLGLIRSFQDAALFPTLTVLDTLRLSFEAVLPTSFLGSVVGLPGNEREKQRRAEELVDLMGLGAYRSKQIQELSTGTRRITELGCLVALAPSVLLLDEPSSGVAQRETEALAQLLRRLKDELDLTMLVIEHDIPMIMGLSDRIIAMDLGRVLAYGTPDEVQANPRVIEAYLGASATTLNRSGAKPGHVPATAGASR